jgi:hypothetical protein
MAISDQRMSRDDADIFEPVPRHPRRRRVNPTTRLLLVVIVALVATVIALLARPQHPGSRTATPTTTQTPTPTATTATTQPTQNSVAGVSVGYPDTRDGAQAAAANYTIVYGSDAMFNTDRRHAILGAIADPTVKPALQAQLDQSFAAVMSRFGLDPSGNPPKGQTFVDRTIPIGVHVLTYSDDEAQIAVWTTGIVGLAGAGSTLPVAEAWNTATITLHWVGGDWKWVAFTQTDGPTPVSGMQPPSTIDQIATAVKEFEGLDYAR